MRNDVEQSVNPGTGFWDGFRSRWSSAPALATSRVMGLTAGSFYAAGGSVALVVILTASFPAATDRAVLLALATTALLSGFFLLRWGRVLPVSGFHLVVVFGVGLITLAIPLCPTTGTALAITTVYAFITIDVMFFFTWSQGAAHLLVLYVAAGWALSQCPGVTLGIGVALGLVCLVITAVVGLLVRDASNAHHDSLTGLRNRRGFDSALDAAVAEARAGGHLSAALIDVDHFKAVNDGAGHAAGDALLQSFSRELSTALPGKTVLARYGGDGFAVLLPGRDGRTALDLVEQVRAALGSANCSAGVAQLLPGETGAALLRRADAALYSAKLNGRARCRLDDVATVELSQDLAQAVADGEVRAWFQPIVTPGTGYVVGIEALARWTHPVRGVVGPDQFIAAAEASDLIVELGAAVLADACRGARLVADAWGREILLTVNVSGAELAAPDYVERVLDVVAATGWPADLLVLEVTESLLDGSSHLALATLDRLRSHGMSVAIDDFGTGYSAFSRLDTLPADYVKLDHGFTADITSSPRRAGILQALLSLCSALGLQVIAEGVETEEQAALLSRLGCPLAQGWLFSPAVQPDVLAGRGAPVPTTLT